MQPSISIPLISSPFLGLQMHRAPTPEPDEDPLPGEHPVPQQDPVPSPFPEMPVNVVVSPAYLGRQFA